MVVRSPSLLMAFRLCKAGNSASCIARPTSSQREAPASLKRGLGLGLSALRIASQPATRTHVVVEKYAKVIELFRFASGYPDNLKIVHADFFDYIEQMPEMSLDGVFFDPELPRAIFENKEFVHGFMPKITAARVLAEPSCRCSRLTAQCPMRQPAPRLLA